MSRSAETGTTGGAGRAPGAGAAPGAAQGAPAGARGAGGSAAGGYALVAGAFLVMGLIGAMVAWATAPESALLVLRFVVAGAALTLGLAARRPLAGVLRRDVWPRLLLMAALDAGTLLLFFIAIRRTSVAVGMFLQFLAPVWVALLAPRLARTRTERVVYPALGLALAGLAVILWPSLCGEGAALSRAGVAAGLAAGVGYALFQLVVKDLTRRLRAVTIVLAEVWLDALLLLPLALWQTVGAGYRLSGRDLVAGLVLGLVCTALGYTMWTAGMGRIKVQHAAILGYLEPVSAPLYAWALLGQAVAGHTVAGGALIVAAGLLVVLRGEREGGEPPASPDTARGGQRPGMPAAAASGRLRRDAAAARPRPEEAASP